MTTGTGETMQVRIERMSYGPDAIARASDGKTIFVSGGAVSGDLAEVQVTQDKGRLLKASLRSIVEPSAERMAAPSCPYVDVCGGCPWAHLSRESQLREKRDNVTSSLVRIGHLDSERVDELVRPTERPGADWGYRNKVELAVTQNNGRSVIGMHAQDGRSVIKVDRCPLFDDPQRRAIKSIAGALSYLANADGLSLQRIGIRASRRTRDLEVALWTAPDECPRAQVAKVLGDAVKTSSIVRVLTKGPQKARRVTGVERLSGKGYWTERIAGGRMDLSAPSFFQVNTVGAERIVELVLEGLSPAEDDEAMDLYCGAGTFALPLGRACGFVSAVESSGPAVRDLRRNLERAQLDNVDAIGGDADREFPDTDADIIVVDPPRAGLAENVVRRLCEQPARAIAYVSCDPATLARDIARFEEIGTFRARRITPVDLFPQTFHVETVCLLRRS